MAFHGIATLVELPNQPGWDPRLGDTIERVWRGSPTAVEAQRLVLRAAGIRYKVEQPDDGSYALIRGFYGAADDASQSEAISDVWDLEGEDLEKSIWEHDRWVTITRKANDDTRAEYTAKARAWIESLGRGDRTWTDDDGTEIALTQAQILENAATLFNLAPGQQEYVWLKLLIQDYVAGVEAFPASRWVLKRTLTVPDGTIIRMDTRNIGAIHTLGQIQATNPGGIDPNIVADCPTTGYWIKRTPRKANVGSGKYVLTYEWWHAEDYSRFVYDTAI